MVRIFNKENTLNSYSITLNEIEVGDRFGYKIIAVVHEEDSWLAYRGLSHWGDSEVAERGDPISYEIAKLLFPTIANSIKYYRDY
jgi:hypothetical protein